MSLLPSWHGPDWRRRVRFAAVLLVVTLGLPASAGAGALTRVMDSVVSLLPEWPPDIKRLEEPEASGVVLFDGHVIVTAAHVVSRATSVRVRTRDGRLLEASLLAGDEKTDIAILKIEQPLPALSVDPEPPVLGARVCAVGNAFGLGLSLTCGVVSGVHRAGVGFNVIEDFVQTDAAVNPGASGGALVTADGRLVGVLSAIFTKKSDANIGVNFAVAAPLAERVARDLRDKGKVDWPDAGLRLVRSPRKGATGRLAAEVRAVLPGLPGEKAGLRAGDLILWAGDRRIRQPADFRSALARLVPPAGLELKIERAGAEQTLTLRL